MNPDKNIYISPWFRVPAVPGPGGGAPAEPGGEGGDPGDQQPHRGHPPPPLAAPGYVQTPPYAIGVEYCNSRHKIKIEIKYLYHKNYKQVCLTLG